MWKDPKGPKCTWGKGKPNITWMKLNVNLTQNDSIICTIAFCSVVTWAKVVWSDEIFFLLAWKAVQKPGCVGYWSRMEGSERRDERELKRKVKVKKGIRCNYNIMEETKEVEKEKNGSRRGSGNKYCLSCLPNSWKRKRCYFNRR